MSEPTISQIPVLSKSRFLAGLQCHKRLYFECFHRDLADPVDQVQQAIFDAGTSVGEFARDVYPGGVLVDYDHFHHGAAVSATKTMVADYSITAIYEAGFQFNNVRTRVDILARTERDMFDLVEVKSTTSVKPEHIPDVAIQFYVLNGSEMPLRNTYLAHLNKEYVYPGGGYDLNQLFSMEDVTEAAELLEIFQWLSEDESYQLSESQLYALKEEIGDVLIYLTGLADKFGLDPIECAEAKIELNRAKYPPRVVKGSAKKYDEY